MATVRHLRVVLEGANEVFSQNDVVRGHVIVDVSCLFDKRNLTKVKGIWIRLKGKAKAHYDSTDADGTTHTAYKRETYIELLQVLFGTGPKQTDLSSLSLSPGRSTFPFEFCLASHKPLPPSLELSNGHIRYTLKATLVVLGFILDDKYKDVKRFTMLGLPLDLNYIPNVKEPLNRQVQEYSCCGCGSTLEVEILFTLPKRGYVPGESIYILGRIDNHDGEERRDFTANLVQYVHVCFSKHSKSTERNILSSKTCLVSCPKGRATEFNLGPLQILDVPRSGPPGCNIINVEYFVEVKDEKIPITIGTIPVRAAILEPDTEPAETTRVIVSMPAQGGGIAPPNYDEVTRMATVDPSDGSINWQH